MGNFVFRFLCVSKIYDCHWLGSRIPSSPFLIHALNSSPLSLTNLISNTGLAGLVQKDPVSPQMSNPKYIFISDFVEYPKFNTLTRAKHTRHWQQARFIAIQPLGIVVVLHLGYEVDLHTFFQDEERVLTCPIKVCWSGIDCQALSARYSAWSWRCQSHYSWSFGIWKDMDKRKEVILDMFTTAWNPNIQIS